MERRKKADEKRFKRRRRRKPSARRGEKGQEKIDSVEADGGEAVDKVSTRLLTAYSR